METETWTKDRIELLKKFWLLDLRARKIAELIGGVTRNAVIGKAWRLGLSSRRPPRRFPLQIFNEFLPSAVEDLREDRCRWPVKEGKKYRFCGCHAVKRKPYCEYHMRMGQKKAADAGSEAASD